MCNALFGARGNADGFEAAAWSAICGRTPLWGNHVKENRYATHVYEIECPGETDIDWDIIGYSIGKLLPPLAVPVLTGNFSKPDIAKLKKFCATIATTSGAEMFHVVGSTPEAETLEIALGGKKPVSLVKITQEIYEKTLGEVCASGSAPIQLVLLGCPHFTLEEMRKIAWYIKDKKIHPNVRVTINVDLSTKAMCDRNGYTKMIEDAGAYILTGCCVAFGEECYRHAAAIATDSAKQVYYVSCTSEATIFYGDKFKCIDAAVRGKWEG